ncbi:MAG: endopeptidase La [Anaerolineales bacterium]|nr:endopeptidase La [Anaerolineales bacterium]
MPASRWINSAEELVDLLADPALFGERSEEPVEDALSSIVAQVKEETSPEPAPKTGAQDAEFRIPDTLPILPLRGVVVYPQTVVPLTVGQPRSIRLVDDATVGERMIGLVTSKDPDLATPGPADLFTIGTAAIVHRLFRAPDGTIRIVVQGLSRIRVLEYTEEEPYLKARVEAASETVETGLEVEALSRNVRDQFSKIAELIPSVPRELVTTIISLEDPLQVAYTISNYQRMDLEQGQEILELDSAAAKLKLLVGLLAKELDVLQLGAKIQEEARSEIEKVQRQYFLREQMKAIQKELGETDEQAAEVEELRKKIEAAGMSEEAAEQAKRELERLAKLPTAMAEYGVIRAYLDWLIDLPWSKVTEDHLDIRDARRVLDEDHHALDDVKKRILEYLAVRKLRVERKGEQTPGLRPGDAIRGEREGAIMCFIGPPGVGKTSLGRSIARAMGRKFIRISLGGVHDEAEIRGHRRTYIGSMPGRILQALRRVESRNPVFMLDEVDKLSADFRGDPAAALLEVLDSEQNREFRDNYLEVAFDLSQVLFITTANQLEPIPGPLLDRMEVIAIMSYTEREKIEIAKNYLIPRQLRENSVHSGEVEFGDDALRMLIRNYTHEAGVRSLEREIGSICRKVATAIAEGKAMQEKITPEKVIEYLGPNRFLSTEEVQERTSVPGVATALAWTPIGGDLLFIEATQMPGRRGFQLTGSLGQVMQESAHAALSYVRSKAEAMRLPSNYFETHDIHLHIPGGAQPKDGPSAGITIATALVSLISGRPVRSDLAMTGEITLRGKVLPVGGVKEKVLAAHRAGLKTVILPRRNDRDMEGIPEDVRDDLKFVLVDTVDEVLGHALTPPAGNGRKRAPGKAKPKPGKKAPKKTAERKKRAR